MFAKKGKYEDSLNRMKESIEILERLEEDDELPRTCANAGASAFYVNLDESLKWHEKSLILFLRGDDVDAMSKGEVTEELPFRQNATGIRGATIGKLTPIGWSFIYFLLLIFSIQYWVCKWTEYC